MEPTSVGTSPKAPPPPNFGPQTPETPSSPVLKKEPERPSTPDATADSPPPSQSPRYHGFDNLIDIWPDIIECIEGIYESYPEAVTDRSVLEQQLKEIAKERFGEFLGGEEDSIGEEDEEEDDVVVVEHQQREDGDTDKHDEFEGRGSSDNEATSVTRQLVEAMKAASVSRAQNGGAEQRQNNRHLPPPSPEWHRVRSIPHQTTPFPPSSEIVHSPANSNPSDTTGKRKRGRPRKTPAPTDDPNPQKRPYTQPEQGRRRPGRPRLKPPFRDAEEEEYARQYHARKARELSLSQPKSSGYDHNKELTEDLNLSSRDSLPTTSEQTSSLTPQQPIPQQPPSTLAGFPAFTPLFPNLYHNPQTLTRPEQTPFARPQHSASGQQTSFSQQHHTVKVPQITIPRPSINGMTSPNKNRVDNEAEYPDLHVYREAVRVAFEVEKSADGQEMNTMKASQPHQSHKEDREVPRSQHSAHRSRPDPIHQDTDEEMNDATTTQTATPAPPSISSLSSNPTITPRIHQDLPKPHHQPSSPPSNPKTNTPFTTLNTRLHNSLTTHIHRFTAASLLPSPSSASTLALASALNALANTAGTTLRSLHNLQTSFIEKYTAAAPELCELVSRQCGGGMAEVVRIVEGLPVGVDVGGVREACVGVENCGRAVGEAVSVLEGVGGWRLERGE